MYELKETVSASSLPNPPSSEATSSSHGSTLTIAEEIAQLFPANAEKDYAATAVTLRFFGNLGFQPAFIPSWITQFNEDVITQESSQYWLHLYMEEKLRGSTEDVVGNPNGEGDETCLVQFWGFAANQAKAVLGGQQRSLREWGEDAVEFGLAALSSPSLPDIPMGQASLYEFKDSYSDYSVTYPTFVATNVHTLPDECPLIVLAAAVTDNLEHNHLFFHATTWTDAINIMMYGVKCSAGRPDLDFGPDRAIYVSPSWTKIKAWVQQNVSARRRGEVAIIAFAHDWSSVTNSAFVDLTKKPLEEWK
ncbi:hypothetical protein HK104_000223 [Borealophlyctis nickersoniae]|nr:hypothetical protein HK104_000223 [Borealophlyctis nickersoniae]